MNRRNFLIGASLAVTAARSSTGAQQAAKPGSLAFVSALEAAAAIRQKKISSVELTRLQKR